MRELLLLQLVDGWRPPAVAWWGCADSQEVEPVVWPRDCHDSVTTPSKLVGDDLVESRLIGDEISIDLGHSTGCGGIGVTAVLEFGRVNVGTAGVGVAHKLPTAKLPTATDISGDLR